MTPTTDADDWLEAALAAAARARVAVFGDFCLDAYWTIDPDERERSLETDLPVRRVRTQRYAPGGAGNIASNLAALGVREVRAVGLVGADAFGRLLRDRLAEAGVDAAGLLDLQPDWQTMVYAKPVVAGVEGRRIDFGAFNVLAPAAADALADRLAAAADEADAVVVNQQVPAGVATLGMIDRVNALAADRTHAVLDRKSVV